LFILFSLRVAKFNLILTFVREECMRSVCVCVCRCVCVCVCVDMCVCV
jgi:hypothetical protein